MKNKLTLKNIAVVVCFAVSFPVLAIPSHLDSLTAILSKIKTYNADFSQEIQDDTGRLLVQTRGKMIVSRPGKFYWKSSAPDPILVVGDGKYIWNYDIELEQITKQDLKKALGSSPAALLVSEAVDIEKDFVVSTVSKAYCPSPLSQCFSLHPKSEDSIFSNVYIGVEGEKITRIEMQDALGQQIVTLFTNIMINQKVDESKFYFKPPKGIDVIIPR